MAELRNNWVVEHGLSGDRARTGDKPVGKGKREGYGGERGSESRGRVKSTQVEINRKVDVEQFARYFYCRYVLGGPYKISLRGIGRVRGRERKAEERG